MAMPPVPGTFSNSFSNGIYKTIDEDVDYITLYYGINDSHHRPSSTGSDGEDQTGIIHLGTIDDTDNTTFMVPGMLFGISDCASSVCTYWHFVSKDVRLMIIVWQPLRWQRNGAFHIST